MPSATRRVRIPAVASTPKTPVGRGRDKARLPTNRAEQGITGVLPSVSEAVGPKEPIPTQLDDLSDTNPTRWSGSAAVQSLRVRRPVAIWIVSQIGGHKVRTRRVGVEGPREVVERRPAQCQLLRKAPLQSLVSIPDITNTAHEADVGCAVLLMDIRWAVMNG